MRRRIDRAGQMARCLGLAAATGAEPWFFGFRVLSHLGTDALLE